MKSSIAAMLFLLSFFAISSSVSAEKGLLYGKVYTYDDEVLEGYIRWDKNEASWDDILDGNKELDRKSRRRYRDRDRDRDREVSIFGITVYREGGLRYVFDADEAQSGIRMGHIRSLVPIGDNEVELVLKSGDEVELKGGSGDIGTDNREILVDDNDEGIIELNWDDIEKIEFMENPGRDAEFGKRLYGTLTTRRDQEFTGFICWDKDETFDSDILDGREEHRKRKIRFSKIEKIERRSSGSADVTLKNGKTMRLDDSNDIDSGNRGIAVSDKNLGSVIVGWDDFDMVAFTDPPDGPAYDDFDGGKRLFGTVYTENGEEFTGDITWDFDEEYTWEILDGELRDIEFNIEFGFIKSIEKRSRRGSVVTLKDGRSFKLRGSNDVDEDNKGIIIFLKDGDEAIVDWEDFDRVEFSTR